MHFFKDAFSILIHFVFLQVFQTLFHDFIFARTEVGVRVLRNDILEQDHRVLFEGT